MPTIYGPIMPHGEGLPLRYAPGGRQQEQLPMTTPGGRLQTPPRRLGVARLLDVRDELDGVLTVKQAPIPKRLFTI